MNILNVTFKVTGSAGSNPEIKLEFKAMAAAKTFADLLPQIDRVETKVGDNNKGEEVQ